MVVKELSTVDSACNRVSAYVFKRPYTWDEVIMLKAKINQAFDNVFSNWKDGVILYSELETVLQCDASRAFAINCFWPQITSFISNLIDSTVIGITQLGCPEFAYISFSTLSYTFACHNKSKHACALQSPYSIAQWLHFHVLILRNTKCPVETINVFQIWTLLEHNNFLNKRRTKYVSVFLDETLQPHVKIASSSHSIVLNQTQWFILVIFKSHISKRIVHELGDLYNTLSMYCGRYIRIMSEDVQVLLNKSEWSELIKLACNCMNRQILKLFRLHEEMIE
jgi:hypothetical protein